jgi:outer membrane immunogenic protein
MKKFLLGAVSLFAMATTAIAADLPARPMSRAPSPMIAAVYDWTGFYVGANGGYGSSRKCFDAAGTVGVALLVPVRDNCGNATGALAGGQIGYNWQTGGWVFGVELQGDWADLKGSAPSLLPAFAGTTARARIDGIGLFTGRVGYAWNSALLYVKGGGAVAADHYNTFVTATGAPLSAGSETRWGAVAGAGIEFGFAPNWSVALEYDHMFMGTRNVTLVIPAGAPAANPVERIHQDVDMGTVRINYRWGGPVIAKY